MSLLLESPFTMEPPPLHQDAGGTIRVGATRVTLEAVVGAWEDGATAEEITEHFDTLRLADVYAVIAFYLAHQEQAQAYLRAQDAKAETMRRQAEAQTPPGTLRERLLARRQAQSQP